MSYASWFGTPQTIATNSIITNVFQNGSNYTATVNVVPEVILRTPVLSTMVDEVVTTFYQTQSLEPGLYKAGFWFQCATGAADVWAPRDYFELFVASDDYIQTPNNTNAQQFYKTKSSYAVPYTEGVDPIGGANGSVYGQHTGYVNISSIQKLNFCAYMEDFNDNATTHAVRMSDPWIQKVG